MSLLDALVQGYLQANVLLAIAFAAWLLVTATPRRVGRGLSMSTQLTLLRLSLLGAILSPLVLQTLPHTLSLGGHGALFVISPSDHLISAYLGGWISLSPSDLEALISTGQGLYGLPADVNAMLRGTLPLLLLAGTLILGCRLLRNLAALRRIVRHAHVWHKSGNLVLLLSDGVAAPFATGSFRRRYVVLPSRLLGSQRDLSIVLSHELQHVRNRDIEWMFLLEGLNLLFFWNPAFVLAKLKADRLTELACDQQVLIRQRSTVADYCDCLLRLSQHRPRRPRGQPLGATPFGKSAEPFLRQRVLALLDGLEPPDRRRLVLPLGVCLMCLIGLTAVSIQPPVVPSALSLHLSTLVNLEQMAERTTERGYNLVMSY